MKVIQDLTYVSDGKVCRLVLLAPCNSSDLDHILILILMSSVDDGIVTSLTWLDFTWLYLTWFDFTWPFHCRLHQSIDHTILLWRLHDWFRVTGKALDWIKSYLTGRCQRINLGDCLSSIAYLPFGVPQGSVLGTLLVYPLYHSIAWLDLWTR